MIQHPVAKKIIATVLSVTLLSTSVYAAPAPQVEATRGVSYNELVGSTAGKSDLIQVEMKNYKVFVDSGVMAPHEAVRVFAQNLVDHNVGFQDIDAYIKLRTTRDEYKKFKSTFEGAMSGVTNKTLTPKDMSELLSNAMASQDISGLSWSGCGGMATGVVLLVGAVVLGITALCMNSESCSGRGDLGSDRNAIAARQQKYQSDMASVQGRQNGFAAQIITNNNQIASNSVQISALQSEINNDPKSDPSYNANQTLWTSQEAALLSQNATLAGNNLTLGVQYSNWNEADEEAATTAQYNSDQATLQGTLASDTTVTNRQVSTAKTLGIIAGSVFLPGLYFTIDGSSGDACNN